MNASEVMSHLVWTCSIGDTLDRRRRVGERKEIVQVSGVVSRPGEVLGNEAILALVSLGCGVGIVPRLVVEQSPLRSEVRPLEVEPELGEFRVGVCTPRRRLSSPVVRALWDSLGTS